MNKKVKPKLNVLNPRARYMLYLVLLFLGYVPSFLNSRSILSRLLLPFLLLFFSGYSLTHLLFKNESIIDRMIIGFGFSVLFNVLIFHSIPFIRNYAPNQTFNYLFLLITLFVTAIPLCFSYPRTKGIKQLDQKTQTVQSPFFVHSDIIVVGTIMFMIFLVQILFVEIPNHSLDEYAYMYIARNLIVDNTNFTATPPWLNNLRYAPRYVFVTLIAVFCSFFGFELESAKLVIIASNLMLIPVVFVSATTFFNRKVGTVAATLIAVNPVYWLLSIRIYPDIPVTVFSWASLYFLLKALKNREKDLIEQKFVIISFIFLILAIFTKYTAVLLLPAFLILFLIYTRTRIVSRAKKISFVLIVLLMLSLSFILALMRFRSYVESYIANLSAKVELWNFAGIYDTMINPLGPISQFSILILIGMVLSLKSKRGKRNLAILVVTWVGYVSFYLLHPHILPDKRHVFSSQVSATIIAAAGVVSISKQRKLWKVSLPVLILAHALDEILEWKDARHSSLLFEAVLLIIVLIFLREGIRRTVRKNSRTVHSLQTVILLGLTLLAFVNAAFLDSYDITWEEQLRDESRVQAIFFLETAGGWLNTHITENETVMTNAYATLPYYAGFVSTYKPPTEEHFLNSITQKNITYLVIFWGTRPFLHHVLGGMTIPDEAPYLERYVWNPPSSTSLVYSDTTKTMDGKEVGVVIFEALGQLNSTGPVKFKLHLYHRMKENIPSI